jgi:hypothetical protein
MQSCHDSVPFIIHSRIQFPTDGLFVNDLSFTSQFASMFESMFETQNVRMIVTHHQRTIYRSLCGSSRCSKQHMMIRCTCFRCAVHQVHHGDTLIWIHIHHHYRSTSTMVEIILVFQSLRSKRSDIIQIVRLIKSSQRSYVVFRYCTR